MSDDIIDTIAEALIGPLWAGFEGADNCYCDPEMGIIDTSGNWVSFCMGDVTKTVAPLLLAALRERYTVVEKSESDHDPFDILCAVNRGESTKSDAICPRCRPAKEGRPVSEDIIGTIEAHYPVSSQYCRCGEAVGRGWAEHVLDALRERYAVVEKSESDHDPFDILCAVNRGESTKSDAICPRCRPAVLPVPRQRGGRPVSDDIIDTIAAELRDWWGYRRDREIEVSTGILTALRGAGCEIVTTEEAKLISLENQPPSAPVAAEADPPPVSVTATIHQDDGSGHCTACGTVWPTECIAERHAVWVAEGEVQ